MQTNKKLVQKILGFSTLKFLLTITLLAVSTFFSQRSRPYPDDLLWVSDYEPLISGFPFEYLKTAVGMGSTQYLEGINYLNFGLNLIFWYLISNLIILSLSLRYRELTIKSWQIVLLGIILLISGFLSLHYSPSQKFAMIYVFLIPLTLIALLPLFLLKSQKRKAIGAVTSISTPLWVYSLAVLFGIEITNIIPFNLTAIILFFAGIHYFWKKE